MMTLTYMPVVMSALVLALLAAHISITVALADMLYRLVFGRWPFN